MRKSDNGGVGPMQIQESEMNGEFFKVPVYKDGELTGEYDSFYAVSTYEDKDNPKYAGYKVLVIEDIKDHFQIGCGYIRRGIDRYRNIFIGLDSNNKGLYAFSNVYDKGNVNPLNSREYYENNFNDFSWTNLIAEHYKIAKNDPNYVYGDSNYLWNVLRYLDMDERGQVVISYDCKGEKINIVLNNLNIDKTMTENYNNGMQRR